MKLRSVQGLRNLLALAGKPYREIERSTGIHNSMISHLATGRRDRLPADKAAALCAELGCSVGLLFHDDIADATATA